MMEETQPKISSGLEGIYIQESKICKVDGINGRLYYRGYSIETLNDNSDYEEVCYLLLYGRLPKKDEFEKFKSDLRNERTVSTEVMYLARSLSKKMHPTDVLKTAVSALASEDEELADNSPEANARKAVRLISKIATLAAAIERARNGKEPVAPDPSLSHTDNFMYMLTGSKPSSGQSKLINTMFVLHAEHSSNASTFTTLVAGSTLADIYSSVTAGMAALKGPLHGGADEAALKMMMNIGDPGNTEQYIEDALAGKQKIMGFGHRVYKTYDPRARILRSYLEELRNDKDPETRRLIEIAIRAEKLMIDKLGNSKGIWPNVDFFSGPLYVWAGIPPELFTSIFAASRMVGWCAHLLEYWTNNRIFRPLEFYTGELDLKYVDIDKR